MKNILGLSAAFAAVASAANLPEVTTLPAPPAGFDPWRASPVELTSYGFPARPSVLNRAAYDHWTHFMEHARLRVFPSLRRVEAVHGPSQHAANTPGLPGQAYSKNWSGYVVSNNNPVFGGGSITQTSAVFVVPIAQSPYGQCAAVVRQSSWAGIDGWNANATSILQAGTESDAYCTSGNTYGSYYAWYEWYPNNTVEITNLPARVGDVFTVFLIATGAGSGQVLVENETTNQYVFLNVSAPGGSRLVGNSAEWIVERPSFNNNLSSLANYVATWMSSTGAAVGNSWFPWGAPAYGNTAYNVTMVDNNGAQLSTANGLWQNGIVFNVQGSAK